MIKSSYESNFRFFDFLRMHHIWILKFDILVNCDSDSSESYRDGIGRPLVTPP